MPSRLAVRSYILFQLNFCSGGGASQPLRSWRVEVDCKAPFEITILFVPVLAGPEQLAVRWANDCDKIILRHCPVCKRDSIVGHGRRRKQAHDEHHDWIGIRRGRCPNCATTFTFLPLFSLPYTHFSLWARSRALWRRFKEHCSWEKAVPELKDADRVPEACTVRRWLRGLDGSQLAISFLRQTRAWVAHWLERGKTGDAKTEPLPWMVSALEVLWPLRL
jgi:Domain of unknown function (DUF6431)